LIPILSLVRRNDTHRLIPSRYADAGSVLARIAESEEHLEELFAIDALTNARVLGEADLLPGIGIHELVFDVPNYHIINAAFTHAHPLGSRFNGPNRGAWYAAFAVETAQAEVAYHKAVDLSEIDHFYDEVTYDDYLADFSAEYHDLRGESGFADCLDPNSYIASQQLGAELLQMGSLGVVYPSVRHAGGVCMACFRPALVANARKTSTYRFTWTGSATPAISLA
jgi:RES domain-containing protein